MKYDEYEYTTSQRLIADFIVVFIMLIIAGLIGVLYMKFIEPLMEANKAADIYLYLIMIPSLILGVVVGKNLVNSYLTTKWRDKDGK